MSQNDKNATKKSKLLPIRAVGYQLDYLLYASYLGF